MMGTSVGPSLYRKFASKVIKMTVDLHPYSYINYTKNTIDYVSNQDPADYKYISNTHLTYNVDTRPFALLDPIYKEKVTKQAFYNLPMRYSGIKVHSKQIYQKYIKQTDKSYLELVGKN